MRLGSRGIGIAIVFALVLGGSLVVWWRWKTNRDWERYYPKVPMFVLKDLEGRDVDLGRECVKSRAVLLCFWTTWCVPCVDQMPALKELGRTYERSDLQIFAIDVGEERGVVRSFAVQRDLGVRVLLDPDKEATKAYEGASRERYQVPYDVLLCFQGREFHTDRGLTQETRDMIRLCLAHS